MLRIISICLLLAGPASSLSIKPNDLRTLEDRQIDESLQALADKVEILAQGKAPERSKLETEEYMWELEANQAKKFSRRSSSKKCGVVFLHGIGVFEPAALYGPVLQQSTPCEIVYPKSSIKPLTALNGLAVPAWFNVEKIFDLTPDYKPPHYGSNMDDVHETIPQIHEAINSLVRTGIPPERIFLGGHSQGSSMATGSALSYPKKLGGLFMVSGSVDGDADYNKKATHWANSNIPIHWEHSLSDNELTIQFMHVGAKEMEKLGHPVEKMTYNANHNLLPRDVFARVGEFISKHV